MTGNLTPTTPAQAFPVPIDTNDPDITDDINKLAKAIEKRVLGVYATTAARDSATTAAGVEEGMFAFTKDTDKVWYYNGTAWVAFPPVAPVITSGTTVPANSSGANGDIFFQV
jgi:hypothetical protein